MVQHFQVQTYGVFRIILVYILIVESRIYELYKLLFQWDIFLETGLFIQSKDHLRTCSYQYIITQSQILIISDS